MLRCTQCDTLNWVGDSQCLACGAQADLVASVMKRHTQNTADFLNEQMEASRALKATERAAAEVRSAQLIAKEHARLEALRQQLLARKAEEKKLLLVLVIGMSVLLLIALLITFL